MGTEMNAQFQQVGLQFTQMYYRLMETDRKALAQFYTNDSMMTFENNSYKGQAQILEKLMSNPVSKYAVLTCDCQPTPNNGVVAFIMGDLAVENNPPMKFAHVVQLFPNGNSYFEKVTFKLLINPVGDDDKPLPFHLKLKSAVWLTSDEFVNLKNYLSDSDLSNAVKVLRRKFFRRYISKALALDKVQYKLLSALVFSSLQGEIHVLRNRLSSEDPELLILVSDYHPVHKSENDWRRLQIVTDDFLFFVENGSPPPPNSPAVHVGSIYDKRYYENLIFNTLNRQQLTTLEQFDKLNQTSTTPPTTLSTDNNPPTTTKQSVTTQPPTKTVPTPSKDEDESNKSEKLVEIEDDVAGNDEMNRVKKNDDADLIDFDAPVTSLTPPPAESTQPTPGSGDVNEPGVNAENVSSEPEVPNDNANAQKSEVVEKDNNVVDPENPVPTEELKSEETAPTTEPEPNVSTQSNQPTLEQPTTSSESPQPNQLTRPPPSLTPPPSPAQPGQSTNQGHSSNTKLHSEEQVNSVNEPNVSAESKLTPPPSPAYPPPSLTPPPSPAQPLSESTKPGESATKVAQPNVSSKVSDVSGVGGISSRERFKLLKKAAEALRDKCTEDSLEGVKEQVSPLLKYLNELLSTTKNPLSKPKYSLKYLNYEYQNLSDEDKEKLRADFDNFMDAFDSAYDPSIQPGAVKGDESDQETISNTRKGEGSNMKTTFSLGKNEDGSPNPARFHRKSDENESSESGNFTPKTLFRAE